MSADQAPTNAACAREVRVLQLRAKALAGGTHVDAEAVASTIARRAEFTRRLTARLVDEMRAQDVPETRPEGVL